MELAEAAGREVIASYEFGNMGTFHLLEDDVHIVEVIFRFTYNNVGFEPEAAGAPNSYYYKKHFEVGRDWNKLMAYLKEFVNQDATTS